MHLNLLKTECGLLNIYEPMQRKQSNERIFLIKVKFGHEKRERTNDREKMDLFYCLIYLYSFLFIHHVFLILLTTRPHFPSLQYIYRGWNIINTGVLEKRFFSVDNIIEQLIF